MGVGGNPERPDSRRMRPGVHTLNSLVPGSHQRASSAQRSQQLKNSRASRSRRDPGISLRCSARASAAGDEAQVGKKGARRGDPHMGSCHADRLNSTESLL